MRFQLLLEEAIGRAIAEKTFAVEAAEKILRLPCQLLPDDGQFDGGPGGPYPQQIERGNPFGKTAGKIEGAEPAQGPARQPTARDTLPIQPGRQLFSQGQGVDEVGRSRATGGIGPQLQHPPVKTPTGEKNQGELDR